jgi:hypothetical protein
MEINPRGAESKKKCDALQQTLDRELRPFVVPLLVAPNLELRPTEVRNGSGVLLKIGDKQCLVTCNHVLEHFQSGVIIALLNDGHGAFHIKHPKLLAKKEKLGLAKELDIALIDVTGVKEFGEKKCFPFSSESVHDTVQSDIVVTMGFPGMWRKSEVNSSCFSTGPLPFMVGDVTQRSLIISEANKFNREVFDYLDQEPRCPDSKDSCGGLSGAPAFYVSRKPFKIAGFIIKRALGSLILTRASTIMELIE